MFMDKARLDYHSGHLLAVAGMFIIFPNCTLNANCEDLIFNTPDTSYCSKSNFASEGCIANVMNYNSINFIQWRQEESCSMKQDSASCLMNLPGVNNTRHTSRTIRTDLVHPTPHYPASVFISLI